MPFPFITLKQTWRPISIPILPEYDNLTTTPTSELSIDLSLKYA